MRYPLRSFMHFVIIFFAILIGTLAAEVNAKEKKVIFWTYEIEPKRMAIQRGLAKRFAESSGIDVELVPVEESQLPTRVVAAAAADALPDVIFMPLDFVIAWAQEGIIDPSKATGVIKQIGPESFASGPLRLVALKSGWAAVPADGWGQLLLYRKDLFSAKAPAAWLGIPDTWSKILDAARSLHDPPRIWGIEVGTDPNQVYTQQVFEQFALSNGARLVNPATGSIDLNTPEMVQTLEFYKLLAKKFTPPGDIYWRQTREDYQAGRSAMTIWSPFILDELAGLRDSAPVTASGLTGPLHQATGIVTAFRGPLGRRPVQWGQVSYFGVTKSAGRDADRWIAFLLEEGYLNWLSMAPEGKFPLRPRFIEGWKRLKIGVDRRRRISDIYPDQLIRSIIAGVERFDRWGFSTGRGACVGQIYGTKTLIQGLRRFIEGEIPSASEAAREMTESIRSLDGCS